MNDEQQQVVSDMEDDINNYLDGYETPMKTMIPRDVHDIGDLIYFIEDNLNELDPEENKIHHILDLLGELQDA